MASERKHRGEISLSGRRCCSSVRPTCSSARTQEASTVCWMFEPGVIQCRNVTSTFMPISVSSNREEETLFYLFNWHPSAPVLPADSLGKTYLIAAGGDGKCGGIFSQCSLKWRCCSGSFTPELFLSGVSQDVSLYLSFSLGESAASEAVLLLVYWTLKAKTHHSFLILIKYSSAEDPL